MQPACPPAPPARDTAAFYPHLAREVKKAAWGCWLRRARAATSAPANWLTPSAAQGKTRRPPYVTRVRPQLKGNSGWRCAKVVSEFDEQGTEQLVLKNQVPEPDADANV